MVDTAELQAHVDLLALVEQQQRMFRAGTTKGGEWAGPCPFCGGVDRFRLWPVLGRFWCRRCGETGDAIDFIRKRDSLSFFDAVAYLNGRKVSGEIARPREPVTQHRVTPAWQEAARRAVDGFASTLSLPMESSLHAQAWLRQRGITRETTNAWNLGWVPYDRAFEGLGEIHSGITIPWISAGKVWEVKIRRFEGRSKYSKIPGGEPHLFGAQFLRWGGIKGDLFLTEGEFDCILLWQELHGDCDVASLGATGRRPTPQTELLLQRYQRIFLAYDVDEPGGEGAAKLVKEYPCIPFIPVDVPKGKDVTEAWQQGVNVREWVTALRSD